MTMRQGLYESRNLVAIRIGMKVGENNVVEMARSFGLTTPIPPYPSIHIGSAEVYPLELIAGYTTFANLGTRTKPNAILRVEDSEGNVLWQTKPDSVPVLSSAEAWIMVDMLKDVVLRGTAVGRVWNAGFRVPSPARPERPTTAPTSGTSASPPTWWPASGSASTSRRRSCLMRRAVGWRRRRTRTS